MPIPRASELEKKYRIRSQGNLVREAKMFGGMPEVKILTSGLIVLAVALLVGAVVLIGVARPGARTIQPVQAKVYDPLLDDKLPVPIPFGAAARRACVQRCAPNDTVCQKTCDGLTTAEFGRRILAKDPKPSQLAMFIRIACDSLPPPGKAEQWRTPASRAVDILGALPLGERVYEGGIALQKHRVLSDLRATIRSPASGSAEEMRLTAGLQRLICLRQAAALTQLAVFQVGRALDTHSERFYRSLEDALLPDCRERWQTLEVESRQTLKGGAA